MRIILAIALLQLGFTSATAELRLRSGEHQNFTRLVVEHGVGKSWWLDQHDGDFILYFDAPEQDVDLRQAFTKIFRRRLRDVTLDRAQATLHLDIACKCHARTAQLRTDAVVIDIYDGPAPAKAGDQDRQRRPNPVAFAAPGPPLRPAKPLLSDFWSRPRRATVPYFDPYIEPRQPERVDFAQLRMGLMELLRQASEHGDVLLSERHAPRLPNGAKASYPDAEGRSYPGVAVSQTEQSAPNAAPEIDTMCPRSQDLNLTNWLATTTAERAFSGLRQDLLGEFDAPNAAAMLRSISAYISLGMGVEARELLAIIPDQNADTQHLRSLSYLVDLEPDPYRYFQRFTACRGAVNLWRSLDQILANDQGAGAILPLYPEDIMQNFALLPPWLKRHFAPVLATHFFRLRQDSLALQLASAAANLPGTANAQQDILAARLQLSSGDAAAAAQQAETLLSGPAAIDAAQILVQAAQLTDRPLSHNTAAQLEALWPEARAQGRGQEYAADLAVAWALAQDAENGLRWLQQAPQAAEAFWPFALPQMTDSLFLATVLRSDFAHQAYAPRGAETVTAIVQRLLELGFPQQALFWLERGDTQTDSLSALLAARAQLALGHADRALLHLSPLTGLDAAMLRAAAFRQLGDYNSAAQHYLAAKAVVPAAQMLRLAGDPTATEMDPSWAALIQAQTAVTPPAGAILSDARTALQRSLLTRSAVQTLTQAEDRLPK